MAPSLLQPRRLLLAFVAMGVLVGPAEAQEEGSPQAPEVAQAPGEDDEASAGEPGVQSQDSTSLSDLEALLAELRAAERLVLSAERNMSTAAPAQRPLFRFQRRERWREHHDILVRLAREVETAGMESLDSTTVSFVSDALIRELDTGREWLEEAQAEALDLLETIRMTPPDSLVVLEIRRTEMNQQVDAVIAGLAESYAIAPIFGLDVTAGAAAHDSTVVERADLLAASLEFTHDELVKFRSWLGRAGVDTVAVNARIAAAEERISGARSSLQSMVALLEEAGEDTSHYRRVIVMTTGAIGTEILDTQVLGGLLSEWTAAATEWLRSNLGAILLRLALIFLLVLATSWLARMVRSAVRRSTARIHFSHLVKNLVVSGSGKAVWLVAFFVALSIVGVDLAPMLAGLGIVGFVVGFALQETLANFASGLMIMVYRPFDVGDFVTTAGVTGRVKDLTLVSTVVQTLDNERIIVPNGKVWGDVINNATAEQTRRVDLVFGISYSDDVDKARAVLEDVLAGEERVLEEPAPMVRVQSLGDSSVDLLCRPWCRTEDFWELRWDLTRAVKKRFDAEGITFPFPQRDVHVHTLSSEGIPEELQDSGS